MISIHDYLSLGNLNFQKMLLEPMGDYVALGCSGLTR